MLLEVKYVRIASSAWLDCEQDVKEAIMRTWERVETRESSKDGSGGDTSDNANNPSDPTPGAYDAPA